MEVAALHNIYWGEKMNHFFEKARERIQKINWSYKEPSKPSHAILVSEFITHGNIFMDYCNYDPNNRRAIFSASKICEIELPIDAKSECIELNEIKDGWAKMISTFYLEWSFLIDQNFPASLKFKELYDPIIKLYERGGRISYHNNELISGKYGWPRNSALILENNPLRCYSDELLDEVDN